jgi:uncharacterized membrane protein
MSAPVGRCRARFSASIGGMFEIMTVLHVLAAILVIGPLVHAVTTAGRALRLGDAAAAAAAARMTRIYAYASVIVVVFGFGLMSAKSPYTGASVAEFSETWVWLSVLLWIVGAALALGVTAPALSQAAGRISDGSALDSIKGRVVASGIAVAILFVAIIVLMVYRPGS